MLVKTLKQFSSTVTGNVQAGQTLEVNDSIARQFISAGMVQEVDKTPLSTSDTDGTTSSVSQAAPASPKRKRTTSKKSKTKAAAK